ncbi:hypothetical protein [Paenibacillus durus]|uniref:hypothetical protein n=1 Tax=Paenibacillus durus TaxID=44251 RepID=UPI0004AE3276|nr:hypothetical protein [Paenibacillus durus]
MQSDTSGGKCPPEPKTSNYFLNAVIHDKPVDVCTPESAAESLEVVEAEIKSADAQGEWVKLLR